MEEHYKHRRARYEAYIGSYPDFWSYLRNYHNAFKALVENLDAHRRNVDAVAYPLLFIARHCMELGFKANIRYFEKYSEKIDHVNSKSHNLEALFKAFKLHVYAMVKNLEDKFTSKFNPEDIEAFDEYCQEVDKLNAQFHLLDKGSYSFRYPVDNDNNAVFAPDQKINVLDVIELFEKTMTLLYYSASVFAKYTDYADNIEQMYQDEMRSAYEDEMRSYYGDN